MYAFLLCLLAQELARKLCTMLNKLIEFKVEATLKARGVLCHRKGMRCN